ncbi:MAG: ribosomal protein S18-alanine N-acetyltransferase, partial [Thermoleophilia bacterium]|nr:ribosomal protein S18-alanine N-acetyltransferase [Thermoleophilia bacterium]
MIIRNMHAADVPAVLAIEQTSFSLPWTRQMIRDELAQTLGWCVVAVDDEAGVVGYLLGRRYPDVWHLMDVAVACDRRRRGIGARLVGGFVAAAEASAKGVLLEVRRTNAPAVSLYEAQGFATIGVRSRYYADTG